MNLIPQYESTLRQPLPFDGLEVWLLSACSFNPYTCDWWQCNVVAVDVENHKAQVTLTWTGIQPCILTHKELARDKSNLHGNQSWVWTTISNYEAAAMKKIGSCT